MKYQSTLHKTSLIQPGVSFEIRRMSFGRRLGLTRSIRDTIGRLKFLEVGDDPAQEAEAAVLAAEIDQEYLKWGLAEVIGLEIDGAAATPNALIDSGPEELVREALGHVLAEAGITETERKNSESHFTSAKTTSPGGNATNAGETDWKEDAVAVG